MNPRPTGATVLVPPRRRPVVAGGVSAGGVSAGGLSDAAVLVVEAVAVEFVPLEAVAAEVVPPAGGVGVAFGSAVGVAAVVPPAVVPPGGVVAGVVDAELPPQAGTEIIAAAITTVRNTRRAAMRARSDRRSVSFIAVRSQWVVGRTSVPPAGREDGTTAVARREGAVRRDRRVEFTQARLRPRCVEVEVHVEVKVDVDGAVDGDVDIDSHR